MDHETIAQQLSTFGTALVTDGLSRLGTGGWMSGVQPLRSEAHAAGPARTVLFGPRGGGSGRVPGFYELIETLAPGDVLVIATGGTEDNVLGDNVVSWAEAHDLAAIVTDGRIRDARDIRALEIPVFTRGVTARPPLAVEPIALDVPVACGGAAVHPGDMLVGDGDGIVVVPQAAVADLLVEVVQVADFEKAMGEALAARRPGTEIQALAKGKKTRGVQV